MFIRPSRQLYTIFDLGSPVLNTENYKAKRFDFELKNSRNMTIKCSLYEPEPIGGDGGMESENGVFGGIA
jgi:hypothetical protein